MKRLALWSVLLGLSLSFAALAYSQEEGYYARCNLKVIKGNKITWMNWQSTGTFVPAGTKLKVTKSGKKATLVRENTGESYTLDIGAKDDVFLAKFVTRDPVDISIFSAEVQANIGKAVAKVGMTKEEAYIAMGPPTNLADVRTKNLTYDDIMKSDLWIYARRRFGKNIGVAFDPNTGKVNRTEGIWGK